eukprot:SAG25_NODE_71_length_17290_cov_41.467861_8_plen_45_part_00
MREGKTDPPAKDFEWIVFVNYLLFFPTHHPLGTRQHGNIKPSEV